MRQLEESLRRLQDRLPRSLADPRVRLLQRSGASLRTARRDRGARSRQARRARCASSGFTGHKDPAIHLQMLSHDYPFDSCQLPLNCFDATFDSFEQRVLPELHRQRIAPLGMKSLGGGGDAVKKKVVRAEDALRYAMSLPVATTISGIDSMRVLRQNLRIAADFTPLSTAQMERLRHRLRADRGRRPVRALQDDREARRRRRPAAAWLPAAGCPGGLTRPVPTSGARVAGVTTGE